MKIKHKKKISNIKKIIIITISISLVCGLLFFASEKFGFTHFINNPINSTPNSQNTDILIDYTAPTDEQKQTGEDIKNQNNQTTTNNDLGISISSVTTDGDVFKVRTIISGAVSNTGTCNIKLTQNDKTHEASSNTYAMTSYSTCQGFNINKTDLGSGEWNLELSVTINGTTSTINEIIALD